MDKDTLSELQRLDVKTSALYYHALMAASPDLMVVLDSNALVLEINAGGHDWLGTQARSLVGQSFEQVFSIGTPNTFRQVFTNAWKTGSLHQLSINVLKASQQRWLDIQLIPIKQNGSGKPDVDEIGLGKTVAMWAIARDISELMKRIKLQQQSEERLQKALQEKETLLQEIHHRVKNNLQVMSAILSLQARFVHDAETVEALYDSRARVHAMAIIHETLHQSPEGLAKVNFATYLQRLIKATIFAHTARSLQIHTQLDLAPIFLNLETAIPCGLLVNEVLMNALKHAFPEQTTGTISIILQPINPAGVSGGVGAENSCVAPILPLTTKADYDYRLIIHDDGIGIPEFFDPQTVESVGMSLVRDLTYQLGGHHRIERRKGTWFELSFSELEYRKRM